VVDNASGDGSPPAIAARFPEVELLEAPENGGYAAGMNLGLARLGAFSPAGETAPDAVLLLTHECLLDREALAALAARLEEAPEVGAVGPLLGFLDDRERVFSAGARIDERTWDGVHLRQPAEMAGWRGRPPHRVDWLDGSCLLARWAAVRAAGAIDERYFMYFEEVDWLRRLAGLGWAVECVPAARAWQQPGVMPDFVAARNRLGFVQRFAPRRILARELLRQAWYALRLRRPGRLAGTLAFLRGDWGRPR
jgi:GT2 family glycosyltransferase